jgi:hypothetical protein
MATSDKKPRSKGEQTPPVAGSDDAQRPTIVGPFVGLKALMPVGLSPGVLVRAGGHPSGEVPPGWPAPPVLRLDDLPTMARTHGAPFPSRSASPPRR